MDQTSGQVMKMRALGYSQQEIANVLGTTQSAVSQRIRTQVCPLAPIYTFLVHSGGRAFSVLGPRKVII